MSQSPSTPASGNRLSTFTITTAGQWYGARIRIAAQRAGFTDNGGYISLRKGPTGSLTAMMFPLHSEFSAPVKRLRFDSEPSCEVDAGTRLVAAIKRMAESLEGVVCDVHGVPLTQDELQAAGDAIDAAAVQRIEAEDAAEAKRIQASLPKPSPVPVRLPDGTIRVPGGLSFTHSTTTTRGKLIDNCHFQFEPMGYYAGQREGLRRAAELLAMIKDQSGSRVQVDRIIAAAFGVELPSISFPGKTSDNLASGFIQALCQMIEGAAQHIDHAGYIERSVARSLNEEKSMAQYERDRHHKTAMKAAATRKAKRAAATEAKEVTA